MKVLVINCGSSSLKYQLLDMENEVLLAKGNFERIGEKESFITHKVGKEKYKKNIYAKDHEEALKVALDELLNKDYGVIESLDEIDCVGHRIVHGGEKFKESVIIDDDVLLEIEKCVPLAPLHNPAGILGIKACMKILKGKPNVAVFDTAFHQTMEKDTFLYPIPYKYYKDYGIRKYGFHGTSHRYVSGIAMKLLGKSDSKIVTCHLGQGSSICAIKDGKSVDTSMGLTPLGGIPMVTRSGDMDPSVVLNIMDRENLSTKDMTDILNKESGLVGLTGLEPDFRGIEEASQNGNDDAKVGVEIFTKTIAQYIVKYAVTLNGLDAIVFTGGIGENQIGIRKDICSALEWMGVEIDDTLNDVKGEQREISKETSKIKVYVIPTDEEMVIARDTVKLVEGGLN